MTRATARPQAGGRRTAVVATTTLALVLLLASPLLDPHLRPTRAAHADIAGAGGTAGRPTLRVVALGDSVPAGSHCACDPFPVVYGHLLASRTGRHVHVDDDAVDGLDTGGLLDDLDRDRDGVATQVAAADVVLVTIGANDFGDHHDEVTEGTCVDRDHDCVSDELTTMRARLSQVLDEVRRLRDGAPTTILVTGYWNVFEDGDVARSSFGATGLRASLALTRRVNDAVAADAAAAGATYVDVFTPFQAAGARITDLLAGDGDHPSRAGHALLARTLLAAGLPRTR